MVETASMSGYADVAAGDLDSAHPSTSHVVSPVVLESHVQEGDDFPSGNLCPFLVNEPPAAGAYFDVPGDGGQLSPQVFEYSRLYRYIYTIGLGRAVRSVRHPINGGWIEREQAITVIRRVSPDLQEQLDAERRRRDLPLQDDLPLINEDYVNNSLSMSRVLTPYVTFLSLFMLLL